MSDLIFIPLSDELIYEHPELISGPVIPFVQDARKISGTVPFPPRLTQMARKQDDDSEACGGQFKPESASA